MSERARANADRPGDGDERRPSFLVGDVAWLAFPDGSFDLVVSTLSMHHWSDPVAGLAEIRRVLHPGARALVWDFRPGVLPSHPHLPQVEHRRWLFASGDKRDAMALALEVQPHPADRAGPRRWLIQALENKERHPWLLSWRIPVADDPPPLNGDGTSSRKVQSTDTRGEPN